MRSQDGAADPRGDVAVVVSNDGPLEAALVHLVLESFGEATELGVTTGQEECRVDTLEERGVASTIEGH